MSMKKGQEVRIWDIFGRAQEGILAVDTRMPAGFTIATEKADSEDTASNGISDMADDQAATAVPHD
jgi:hypothetical protein